MSSSVFNISGPAQRELRPIFEAKTGTGDSSFLQRVAHAVGSALSKMGYIAFAAGVAVAAIMMIPVSAGSSASLLTLPAYLALAGGSGVLLGELSMHLSERHVSKLTFSA